MNTYDCFYTNRPYQRKTDSQKEAIKIYQEVTNFIKTYNTTLKLSKPKVTIGNRTQYKSKGFDVQIEVSIAANNNKYTLTIVKDQWTKERGDVLGIAQPVRVQHLSINLYNSAGVLIDNYGGPRYLRNFQDTFLLDVKDLQAGLNLMLRDIYQIPRGQPWCGF